MITSKNSLQIAFLVAVVFPLLMFCLSCGKKGDPVPPKIVSLAAVSDLSAMVAEGGIVLDWSIPENNTDVDGFKIYRSELKIAGSSCPGCPREYFFIADLPCRDPKLVRLSYLDSNVKVGCLYSYNVVIYNSSGYCSDESNIAVITDR